MSENGDVINEPTVEFLLKQTYAAHRARVKDLEKEISHLKKELDQKTACKSCKSLQDELHIVNENHEKLLGFYKLKVSELETSLENATCRNKESNKRASSRLSSHSPKLSENKEIRSTLDIEPNAKKSKIISFFAHAKNSSEKSRIILAADSANENLDKSCKSFFSPQKKKKNCETSCNVIPETLLHELLLPEHIKKEQSQSPEILYDLNAVTKMAHQQITNSHEIQNKEQSLSPVDKFPKAQAPTDSEFPNSTLYKQFLMCKNEKIKQLKKKSPLKNNKNPAVDLDVTMLSDDFKLPKSIDVIRKKVTEGQLQPKTSTQCQDLVNTQTSPSLLFSKKSKKSHFHALSPIAGKKQTNSSDSELGPEDLLYLINQTSPESKAMAQTEFSDENDPLEENLLKNVQVANNSFDVPPSKRKQLDFKYQMSGAIRKHSERAKLNGYDCHDCEKYYSGLNLSEEELAARLKSCSRHRGLAPRPKTPEHFWDIGFPSTPESKARGHINDTQTVILKPRRKKPLNP